MSTEFDKFDDKDESILRFTMLSKLIGLHLIKFSAEKGQLHLYFCKGYKISFDINDKFELEVPDKESGCEYK